MCEAQGIWDIPQFKMHMRYKLQQRNSLFPKLILKLSEFILFYGTVSPKFV